MIFIIFLISILNIIIFRNNPKNLIFYLLILFPYFGLVEIYLRNFTILYSIFYDFIFIIPIYCLYFFKINKYSNFIELKKISILIFVYILFHLLYIFIPNSSSPFPARLIGLKVWVFYIYFIYIGFYFLETKEDFKKIINILSLGTIIPCIILSIQFFITIVYGHEYAFFLINDKNLASTLSQGFSSFSLGPIKVYRLNSTFSFLTELSNYLYFSLVPVITSLYLNNKSKYLLLNKLALILVLVGLFMSGSRSVFMYLPILLFFYIYFKKGFKFFVLYLIFFICFFIFFYLFNILYFKDFMDEYYILFSSYSDMVTANLFDFIISHFWGNGVGTATGEVRFLYPIDYANDPATRAVYERYYYKIIYETGFIGLLAYIFITLKYISYPLKLLTSNIALVYKVFASISLSFLIMVFYLFAFKSFNTDIFPITFIKFFLIGILLKIYFLRDGEFKIEQSIDR